MGEYQFFDVSPGGTKLCNLHPGGKISKSFLLGSDFTGHVFSGEISGVFSAVVLRQNINGYYANNGP